MSNSAFVASEGEPTGSCAVSGWERRHFVIIHTAARATLGAHAQRGLFTVLGLRESWGPIFSTRGGKGDGEEGERGRVKVQIEEGYSKLPV